MKFVNLAFLISAILCSFSVAGQHIPEQDSLEIASKIDDWNNAWKIKDVELACKWYTDDADFTNAFGRHQIGRTAIQEFLSGVFKMDFVMAGVTEQTSLKLKHLADGVILAITTVERRGQMTPDNEALGVRRTTHHRIFQNRKGWFITAHLISDARSTSSANH